MVHSDSTRLAHESFVSGHHGSSLLDVIITVWPIVPGSLIASSFTSRSKPTLWFFCIEYFFCIIPLVMSFTVCNQVSLELNVILLLFLLLRMAVFQRGNAFKEKVDLQPFQKGTKLSCLTSSRATVNIATIVAILAVDFHVFSRRFAKTETYGYSLMDVGAACYLLMNGITDVKKTNLTRQTLRGVLVVFALGLLRLLSLRALNYQQHATEYGAHCNFFFTLAAVKVLCVWWAPRLSSEQRLAVCVAVAAAQEAALHAGLAAWALGDAPRTHGIWTANREWLVSLPGNVLLYLLGMGVGDVIFAQSGKGPKFSRWVWLPLAPFFVLFLLHLLHFEPSRRLANVAFVTWIVGFFLVFLIAFTVMESIFGQQCCYLFQSINLYGLQFFFIGNLITGFVNLSVNTVEVNNATAFIIINLYTFTVCYLVYSLNSKKSAVR